ncbi:MAG: FAD-dependent oxidoreductase [Methylococcaceae bacterium]|nr:MAG: FAD-dependent oxidoreductase [Methylococcaceae bacterium]
MTTVPDITIIGGGIIGMLTAREFHSAGAQVVLLEKQQVGQESSWAGGGILMPLYPWRQEAAISVLVKQSLALYPSLALALHTATEIDPEWNPCGLLLTQNPDYELAQAWCEMYQMPYQAADEASLASLPTATVLNQPLWMPTVAQIRNPRLVKSLRQDLLNKGVRIIEHCDLYEVITTQQQVQLLITSKGNFAVKEVIITAGAWTQKLLHTVLPRAQVHPIIQPVKGQMLLFDAKPDTLTKIILAGEHYLIPRRDGKILAGSTVEHHGFEKYTTDAAKQTLYNFALNLLPELCHYPVLSQWAGLRPGTNTGVPYIGRHPEFSNLSINAGHFRNGLVMGPASAQLLCAILSNQLTLINPEPYQITSQRCL